MSHRRLAVLMVGFLAALSCDDPLAVSDCPDQVQVSVSAGTTPAIDWTPRCHLVGLLITAYGETIWDIGGPQRGVCGDDGGRCYWRNTLYPPIRYGVVPRDVKQYYPFDQEPKGLRVGWPYQLRLSRGGRQLPGEVWLAVDTFVVAKTTGTPR